jgi:peptidyl-prolyl cis-trans isomerase A (cyclophilin A)
MGSSHCKRKLAENLLSLEQGNGQATAQRMSISVEIVVFVKEFYYSTEPLRRLLDIAGGLHSRSMSTVFRFAACLSVALLCTSPAPAQAAGTAQAPKLPPGIYAVIQTSMGTITAELFDQATPNTVRNFIGLARGTRAWLDPKTRVAVLRPLYQNLLFHRVIPDFMIQTGDPTGTGAHNCGFTIKDEIVPTLKFDRPGRLAMANTGHRDSGACQFFITEAPYPAGNGMYTIFGQVVDGQNVVPKISHVITDSNDKPRFPIKLVSVNVIRVVPAVQGSSPAVTGPGFLINADGDVLTRYQLVRDCTELRLADSTRAALAVYDRQNDIALLHSGRKTEAFAVFPEVDGAPAGEPLMTGGNVAIPAAVATGFLESNGIRYAKSAGQPAAGIGPAAYSVEVQCWK